MRINERKVSDITFTVHDEITDERFGARVCFGNYHVDLMSLDRIHFSYIEELENTVKLLTDMYNMAIEQRKLYYKIEEPYIVKEG
jgi:hypothetical protein